MIFPVCPIKQWLVKHAVLTERAVPTLVMVGRKRKQPITLEEHLKRISKRGGKARMEKLSESDRQQLAAKAGRSGGKAGANGL